MPTHTHLRILYVNLVAINKVAAFHYDGRGILQFVRTVPDSGKAPCWAIVNHSGTRLQTTNTGDNSISVYDLTDLFNPKEIQHFGMANTTGSAFSTVIDDADQFIYVSTELGSAGNTCSQHDPHVKRKRRWSINRTLLTYDSSHQWSYGGARSRGVPDEATEGRREDETCLRSDKRMGGRRS
jgi:hypothetical protein